MEMEKCKIYCIWEFDFSKPATSSEFAASKFAVSEFGELVTCEAERDYNWGARKV